MFDLRLLTEQPIVKFSRQLPIFNWHYPFDRSEDRLEDHSAPFNISDNIGVRRRAVYIHIPFCDTICNFCLFQKVKYQSDLEIQKYLKALLTEFELKRELLGLYKVDAIFVGGGTPSTLTPEQIDLLGRTIHESFNLHSLKEFSFEVEVKSITSEKLDAMRNIGVNRVSFGAQTFSSKFRTLFAMDATLEQIQRSAELLNSKFPYTNVDVLYGMAGQNEDELHSDAEAALRLQTTTIDFYPINNLTAPRPMHRAMQKSGLDYLPASTRVQYRIHLDNLLRSRSYTPINGYSYSVANCSKLDAVIQHAPKFLYHDIVYGYHDDEIIGYGSSAISQMMGFNLYNNPDRRLYMAQLVEENTLPHVAFGPIASTERGVVTFPFRGRLDKARVPWARLPDETWVALQEAIEARLVVENHDCYELSPLGWLFYVNLMYFLMPKSGKNWILQRIAKHHGDGRRCGDTDLSALTNERSIRVAEAWLARSVQRGYSPTSWVE